MILQIGGGIKTEELEEKIKANNRVILADGDKRYVNEQGNENVESLNVGEKLMIKDLDIYQEINQMKDMKTNLRDELDMN